MHAYHVSEARCPVAGVHVDVSAAEDGSAAGVTLCCDRLLSASCRGASQADVCRQSGSMAINKRLNLMLQFKTARPSVIVFEDVRSTVDRTWRSSPDFPEDGLACPHLGN